VRNSPVTPLRVLAPLGSARAAVPLRLPSAFGLGSWVLGLRSWIVVPRPKAQDRRPKTQDRLSFIPHPLSFILLLLLAGCAQGPEWTVPPSQPLPAVLDNPLHVPINNPDFVWEAVADVVADYFRIDREEPVRLLGSTLTEGFIETFPKPGATLVEPWDHDSVTSYDRLECTLQSIRRRAVVRIVPAEGGGFWVDMAVLKELENLKQPQAGTAGAAVFPYTASLTRVTNPPRHSDPSLGWIPQGRDSNLEQRMLGQLQFRLSPAGQPQRL